MSALVPLNGVPIPPRSTVIGTSRTECFENENPTTSTPKLQAITSIALVNVNAATRTLLLEWTTDDITFNVLWYGTLALGATVAGELAGLPLYLMPGAKLYGTASAATSITVTTSALQLG